MFVESMLVGALALAVTVAGCIAIGLVVVFRSRSAGERAGPVLLHLTVLPTAVITIVTLLGAL